MRKVILLLMLGASALGFSQRAWLPTESGVELQGSALTINSESYTVTPTVIGGTALGHTFTPEYLRFHGVVKAAPGPTTDQNNIQLKVTFFEGMNTNTHRLTFRYRPVWSGVPGDWVRVGTFFSSYPPAEGFGNTDYSYRFGLWIYAPTNRTIEIQPLLYRRGSGGVQNGDIDWYGRIFRFDVRQ